MPRTELDNLEKQLLSETVFAEFVSPLIRSFDQIRYSPAVYRTLSMPLFAALGCLRHLQGSTVLREFIQTLLHCTEESRVPLARSTAADALSSTSRQRDLEAACEKLYETACRVLPDRLKAIQGLAGRQVFAVDGTYQKESAHYKKQTPGQGGKDNPKGHCILSFFDVCRGIPVNAAINTGSDHEMLLMRNHAKKEKSLFTQRHALWVVDKAFTATPFWDEEKVKRKTEVIMRLKENMIILEEEAMEVPDNETNTGVLSDKTVTLKASNKPWRLVIYQTPEGNLYTYLTNNFDLEPGVVAFLYLRRWDEEKSFDPWKNDFAQKKAWSKNKTAIQNQTTLAVITSILVALFEKNRLEKMGMKDEKVLKKKAGEAKKIKKQDRIKKPDEIKKFRWFHEGYKAISKTSKQIFRFLKHCYLKKASSQLYERQLKPLYSGYL